MINKKALVLGSTGMLGHQVYFKLKNTEGFEVYDLSFKNKLNPETIICDITETDKLSEIIQDIKPDFIINCIGILIKGSNQNPKNAIFINSYFPHWLVAEAEKSNSKIIHISTDCVFSGKQGSYLESDYRDADDIYGRCKALGEIFSDNHLTLRTSIIGPEIKIEGEGLFHWFMHQKGNVNGYTNAFWGGVTTLELSKVILESINQNLAGLIHITNGNKISKFEMLQEFNKFFNTDLEIHPFEGKSVDKSLKSERTDFNYKIPLYSEMIKDMKNNMQENQNRYKKFYSDEK